MQSNKIILPQQYLFAPLSPTLGNRSQRSRLHARKARHSASRGSFLLATLALVGIALLFAASPLAAEDVLLVGQPTACNYIVKNVLTPASWSAEVAQSAPPDEFSKYKVILYVESVAQIGDESQWDLGNDDKVRKFLADGGHFVIFQRGVPISTMWDANDKKRGVHGFSDLLGFSHLRNSKNKKEDPEPLVTATEEGRKFFQSGNWVKGLDLSNELGQLAALEVTTPQILLQTDDASRALATRNPCGKGSVSWFSVSPFRLNQSVQKQQIPPESEADYNEGLIRFFQSLRR